MEAGPELQDTWQHQSPSQQGGGGLELQDTWRHQNPPQQGDRSRDVGHVTAPERHVIARHAPCLDLIPVCGVPGLQGTNRCDLLK
jgi:hypothetical protein